MALPRFLQPIPCRLVAALCLSAASLVSPARSQPVHSSVSPFSVTVDPGSTVFNNTLGFAGDEALFSSFGLVGTGAATTIRSGSISLLFTADPGFVFTSASLDFDGISWLNTSFGGNYRHTGDWTISTGTYVGAASGIPDFNSAWFVTGQSGGFDYYNPFQGSSGNSGFGRDMMNGSFQLGGVTAFTVTMNTTVTVSLTTQYAMDVYKVTATTAVAAVPEPSAYALLVASAIMLGTVARRRRRGC